MGKKALVIGATGLIGTELIQQLLSNDDYKSVTTFTRKPLDIKNEKYKNHVVNFDALTDYAEYIVGDVLFCCMGTTMRVAGSKEQFTKVDYTYPLQFATIAKQNGVANCILISSIGANAATSNFYLQTKGKLENAINALGFSFFTVLRPSFLLGKRVEFRIGEIIAKFALLLFGFLLIGKLKKYKGIEAKQVAANMIYYSKHNQVKFRVVESDVMQTIKSI